jgi:hypothetical protein
MIAIPLISILTVFAFSVVSAPMRGATVFAGSAGVAALLAAPILTQGFTVVPKITSPRSLTQSQRFMKLPFSSTLNAEPPTTGEMESSSYYDFPRIPYKMGEDFLTNLGKLFINTRGKKGFLGMKVVITHKDSFDETADELVIKHLLTSQDLYLMMEDQENMPDDVDVEHEGKSTMSKSDWDDLLDDFGREKYEMIHYWVGDEWHRNPEAGMIESSNQVEWPDESTWPKHTGEQVRQKAYELLKAEHEKLGLTFDTASDWKPDGFDDGLGFQ